VNTTSIVTKVEDCMIPRYDMIIFKKAELSQQCTPLASMAYLAAITF